MGRRWTTLVAFVVAAAVWGAGVSCSSTDDAAATDAGATQESSTRDDVGQSSDAVTTDASPEAAAPAPRFLLPRESIGPADLGVLVNADDPQSVAVGAHYAQARAIPAKNVITLHLGASFATAQTTTIDAATFATWKTQIDTATPASVEAYAVTWIYPSVVDCMSLTSALAFGYDVKWCTKPAPCAATAPSPYYQSTSTTPHTTHAMRPAMIIAGASTMNANALVDRGVSADATYPLATGYLVRTSDTARSVRYPDFQTVFATWNKPSSLAFVYQDDSTSGTGLITNKTDVLFYFTGLASVDQITTNQYLPGAMADHLTSYGGQIPTSGQMSILRWIEAGATGSFGTVVEPCNYPTKFTEVSTAVAKYFAGATLLEAYWKSVAWPGEGLFIGEPLARPYGTSYSFKAGTLTIRTTALVPNTKYKVESAASETGPWTPVMSDIQVTAPALKTIAIASASSAFYRLVAQCDGGC